MKTSAMQFFDIWEECVQAVAFSRAIPVLADSHRSTVVMRIDERHGERVALEAGTYFDRLRADSRRGAPEASK